MLKRHIVLRYHILPLENGDLDEMLLPTFYEKRINTLAKSFKLLNDVLLQLQQQTYTIQQATAYLDFVLNCT